MLDVLWLYLTIARKRKLFPKWIRMIFSYTFFLCHSTWQQTKKNRRTRNVNMGSGECVLVKFRDVSASSHRRCLAVVCASRNLINEFTKLFILRKMKDDLSGETSAHRRPFGGEGKAILWGPIIEMECRVLARSTNEGWTNNSFHLPSWQGPIQPNEQLKSSLCLLINFALLCRVARNHATFSISLSFLLFFSGVIFFLLLQGVFDVSPFPSIHIQLRLFHANESARRTHTHTQRAVWVRFVYGNV